MSTIQRLTNRALSAIRRAQGQAKTQTASPEGAQMIDHAYTTIEGEPASMADLRGKAVLMVNTASQCGYTAQYEGLERLYQKYKDRGLVVIGFPCDDFGHQEPGSEAEIAESCKIRFGVSFPLSAKVHVKGPEKIAMYKALTEDSALKGEIPWNFTKFLLDTQGRPIARFDPAVNPEAPEIEKAIEAALPR